MATTTTNFGWDIPQSTDLVKDGATAIAALGQDIDTALVDLKGGTTGQVLAKASGTDLDFSWVAVDPLTILDAKGDLISATAPDTPARLAVGTNGQILTADSSTATGLTWATAGGWTSLATGNLSGTSTTVNITTTGYKDLVIFQKDTVCTGDYYYQLRLNGDTGSNYVMIAAYQTSSTAMTTKIINDTSFYTEATYEATDQDTFAYWTIMDPANATTKKIVNGFIAGKDNNNTYRSIATINGQYFGTTAAISSVTFIPASTYSSGTYEIYGVK
jgi:hypothetical protein